VKLIILQLEKNFRPFYDSFLFKNAFITASFCSHPKPDKSSSAPAIVFHFDIFQYYFPPAPVFPEACLLSSATPPKPYTHFSPSPHVPNACK